MALTQTAEYALRAVTWLAQNPGQPQTTQAIAEATQVPSSYLPKVFQPLVRSGLITGQRGIHGGYTLQRDPAELTLLDVVDCVDPIQRIERCPLSLKSHGTNLCPLHAALDQVLALTSQRLAKVKIADLLTSSGSRPRPLCEVAEQLREEAQSRDTPEADAAPAPSSNGRRKKR
jgi:Rrf2 family protein